MKKGMKYSLVALIVLLFGGLITGGIVFVLHQKEEIEKQERRERREQEREREREKAEQALAEAELDAKIAQEAIENASSYVGDEYNNNYTGAVTDMSTQINPSLERMYNNFNNGHYSDVIRIGKYVRECRLKIEGYCRNVINDSPF